MSSSDNDTESSNLGSPFADSPQQVPQLTFHLQELTCVDGAPYLRILVQPQQYFRFRYQSEMVGTHGCLLGETYGKTKTHPTVELVNYTGRAVIRCRLAQDRSPKEHPHKLLEDEQDRDVSSVVPEQTYKVAFSGMGIIHTAKKDVPKLLYQKYMQNMNPNDINRRDLSILCENEAKSINLNIVRLRFSAHHIETDHEICEPVFSRPIYNLKCAATNDLKICKMSSCSGSASGGEEVFIFVEKVNKKNIAIRFYELDENGDEVWSANGNFNQSDVHHQYGIAFRTPKYRDGNTLVKKKVYIELRRPGDGRSSAPMEYEYRPSPQSKLNAHRKKRKATSSIFSSCSSTESSLKSVDIPTTVELMIQNREPNDTMNIKQEEIFHIPQIPKIPQTCQPLVTSDLGEALYGVTAEGSPSDSHFYDTPMLPHEVSEPPNLQLSSAEFDRILKEAPSVPANERDFILSSNWTDYLNSFVDSIHEEQNSYSLDIVRSMIKSDSGKTGPEKVEKQSNKNSEHKNDIGVNKISSKEYTAVYKTADGLEVKKLVKELCDMIREKKGIKKAVVKAKLEKLFEMRLSNGDTFLHMTLCSRQPSLEYIVKLIHSMKMTHLLNMTNHQSQTILHLAVMHDMPKNIPFLLSKGCDPAVVDVDGNNVVHYTVMYQSSLVPLLIAIKENKLACNLNEYNNEKLTALHLAVKYKSAFSARKLLEHGASYTTRDAAGRTPLHLAADTDGLAVARELVQQTPPSELDALDSHQHTALQILCAGVIRENTLDLVKLLLEKGADPLKCEGNTESAWNMVKNKPELRDAVEPYVAKHAQVSNVDIKTEIEDDFESADEGEYSEETCECLEELSAFVDEVAENMDASGRWQELAKELHLDSLHSWYSNTASPTKTLLHHIKDNMSSSSLATILEKIGEEEAANIIKGYISNSGQD
ncbi:hypothetical protein ACJJTC_007692 [Scirpophaga incertulas]